VNYLRTTAEPLTIAYIAMGAQTYMKTPAFQERGTQPQGGELEFISDIIDHALMLDRKADTAQDSFSGVFVYDVAEEFGHKLAQRLTEHCDANNEFVESLADTLIAAACV